MQHILVEDLAPGTKLPTETVMREMFHVARGSLREALHILEVYGLLSIRPGRDGGVTVEAVGPPELARLMMFYLNVKGVTFGDLQESARVLHAALAGEAAKRKDPQVIAEMREALQRATCADADGEYGAAVRDFHNALFRIPGGDFLGLVYDAVVQIVLLRLRRQVSVEAARENLFEHQRIVEAIAAGDVEAASRAASDHVGHLSEQYGAISPGILEETVTWK